MLEKAELEALLYLLNTSGGLPFLRPRIETHGSARATWHTARAHIPPERLARAERFVQAGLKTIDDLGVVVLTLKDRRYPERLRHLEDAAPWVLFARGRLELLDRVILGVVGSRRCTEYGIECTRALTMPVARAGAVIVSGLALGIDSCAHGAALDVGGDTIAVLGCGIDICYPRSARRLFERISSTGLLLSEFAPGTPPLPFHFPHRNRIIALLSHAVLVVEATEQSGSLITARRAMQHIHAFAVPGPIGRPTSAGCNGLIREGAELVTSAAEIVDFLKLDAPAPAAAPEPSLVAEEALQVWRVLTRAGLHVDEVAARARLPLPAVNHALLQLELAGHARQLPGSRFALPAAVTG
jgi:DNA processing protein